MTPIQGKTKIEIGRETEMRWVESHWIRASLLIIANTITLIFDEGIKHEDCTAQERRGGALFRSTYKSWCNNHHSIHLSDQLIVLLFFKFPCMALVFAGGKTGKGAARLTRPDHNVANFLWEQIKLKLKISLCFLWALH